jgi:hypothetical protein
MTTILALLLSVVFKADVVDQPTCSGLAAAYGDKDVDAIRRQLADASTQFEELHALYRLYPLTEDLELLLDIPTTPGPEASASETALLAALWTWRGARSKFLKRLSIIMKGVRMLDLAREMDPDDPFVLLVDGQALIYKPKIAGGSIRKALATLQRLRSILESESSCHISIEEVDSWIWFCLNRLDDPEAESFKQRFLAAEPAPLFRQFVLSPP